MKIIIPGQPQLVPARGAGAWGAGQEGGISAPLRAPQPHSPSPEAAAPFVPCSKTPKHPQVLPGVVSVQTGSEVLLGSIAKRLNSLSKPRAPGVSSWPRPCPHIPAQTPAKETTHSQRVSSRGRDTRCHRFTSLNLSSACCSRYFLQIYCTVGCLRYFIKLITFF